LGRRPRVNVVDRDNLLVAFITSALPAMPHGGIRKASTNWHSSSK
jgi:hypothetical protein